MRRRSRAVALAWCPSDSDPLCAIVTTVPGARPHACAAAASCTRATYCSSAKWFPPPIPPMTLSWLAPPAPPIQSANASAVPAG